MKRTLTDNNSETQAAEKRDADTRRRICEELDKNFIVEAAAGTGKTTSIVNRMVSLVAHGCCQIEQLAAVTFTRKAAAELRERFQAELRRSAAAHGAATTAERAIRDRLLFASDNSSRAFVGTIHSFCAALLRERPVEFGVDPTFRELDEREDLQLREQAWLENISDLIRSGNPLFGKLNELGIDRHLIKNQLNSFINHRDVDNWPHAVPPDIDIADIQRQTREYIDHMQLMYPLFSTDRGSDKLMDRYETIVRASGKDWTRLGIFFNLLERFDTSHGGTQRYWHDKAVAKAETKRWQQFRDTVAKPAMQYWCRLRYQFVVDFLRRTVTVYERLKAKTGGLDFSDLLLISTRGLKKQPELRKYFQSRYTHLLVDEFQDTDPVQAEMILYLTSEKVGQTEWQKCAPKSGALFLVGDPKQSIYRFRRGDIVTYNRVKEISNKSSAEVLALVKNFRSRTEIRTWNNQIFQGKFLLEADRYSPAAEDMVQGRVDAPTAGPSDSDLYGVHKLSVDTDTNIDEATEREAESIARFIRHAIDAGMSVPRTEREIELGRSRAVEARDFLIIPWGKKRIGVFRAALEAYGIPCEVTGGNAFGGLQKLKVLIDCLRAIDDPHNPVHFLALLRDELFGFSDRELYRFKKAGGRFAFTSPVPEQLDEELKSRFQDATDRFKRYQIWLRALPFTVAVSRVAEDLGLLASAAASSEGNVTAGGLLKAIERLRSQSFEFDTASELITYFEQLLVVKETEGCTALPPNGDIVRVMNLHKAKGLEAPVVFLADTSMKYRHPVLCHIDRSGNEPVGYMGITAKNGQWATKNVATPENWQGFQDEEQRYLDAEADRLLYVATTRAACAVIVSVGKDNSNWSGLHRYLSEAPELEIPTDQQLQKASRKIKSKPKSTFKPLSSDQTALKWATATQPNYAIATAKELALKGATRPHWETSGDYGYQWGSAVHELLEICTKSPKADLRASAVTLASEHDLGSERIDELLAAATSVTRSEIWKRAQAATRCYGELPFETSTTDDTGKPTIIRGVIDLIFEEPDGWTIVDYKTDDISPEEEQAAIEYYSKQIERYSLYWETLTGFNVTELGLYFTRLSKYSRVE